MANTQIKKSRRQQSRSRAKPEPPWNVILHNDWDNDMFRVVYVLKKCIPGMTIKKALRVMLEAHTRGRAVVKSCHKELAELYQERLRDKGLQVSLEPAP